jgi:hypothetical protein
VTALWGDVGFIYELVAFSAVVGVDWLVGLANDGAMFGIALCTTDQACRIQRGVDNFIGFFDPSLE